MHSAVRFIICLGCVTLFLASGCGPLAKGRPEPPYDRGQLRHVLNGTPLAESSGGADLKELVQVDEGKIYKELTALRVNDESIVTKITAVFKSHNIKITSAEIDRVRGLLTQIASKTRSTDPSDSLRGVIAKAKADRIDAAIATDAGGEYPRIVQKIQAFYATPNSNAGRRQDLRDEIVDLSLVLINLEFAEFTSGLSVKSKAINAGSSIASIGADAAATLVSPASTVRILAAISGGIEASRVTINKEYLYEETTRVLISQMNAQREVVFQDISVRIKLPIDKYTMAQAFHDIDRYYNAGTIDGAFAAIQKNAGAQQQAAEVRSEQDIRKGLEELSASTVELKALFAKMPLEDVRKLVAGLYEAFTPRDTGLEPAIKRDAYLSFIEKNDDPPAYHYTDAEIDSLKVNSAEGISIINVDIKKWITTLATRDQLAVLVDSMRKVAPAFAAAVRADAQKSGAPLK